MEKQFEFNDCGVCTNPNKYGVGWRNEVRTAQCPNGKWVFGISYQFDTTDCEGGGFGASSNAINQEVFDTEYDAAMAAIKYIEHRASKRFTKGDTRRAGIDMCISAVFYRFNQTTLF